MFNLGVRSGGGPIRQIPSLFAGRATGLERTSDFAGVMRRRDATTIQATSELLLDQTAQFCCDGFEYRLPYVGSRLSIHFH